MPNTPLQNSWWRFPASVVVAFIASVVTGFSFALIEELLGITSGSSAILTRLFSPFLFNAVIGFIGVFLGGRCLRPREQVIGAVILVLMGTGFESSLGYAHGGYHFPRGIYPAAIGGCVAVAFFYWQTRSSA